jgi:hypothetical protein
MKSGETIALGSFAVALVTLIIVAVSLMNPRSGDAPSPAAQVNHAAHLRG